MARLADITLEIRTNRLLAGARAAQTAGDLGDAKDSTTRMVALARACRLYLEASQPTLALARLEDFRAIVATAESDDVTRALTNLADDLAKAIKGRA